MTTHIIELVTSCTWGKRAKESQAAYSFVCKSLLGINTDCSYLVLGGGIELQMGMLSVNM